MIVIAPATPFPMLVPLQAGFTFGYSRIGEAADESGALRFKRPPRRWTAAVTPAARCCAACCRGSRRHISEEMSISRLLRLAETSAAAAPCAPIRDDEPVAPAERRGVVALDLATGRRDEWTRGRRASGGYAVAALDLAAGPAAQARARLRARREGVGAVTNLPASLPTVFHREIVLTCLATEHRDAREAASRRTHPKVDVRAAPPHVATSERLTKHLPPEARARACAEAAAHAAAVRRDVALARAYLVLAAHLPPGHEAAAHADLRKRSAPLRDETARAQLLVRLAKHLPPGAEATAHADLRRLAAALQDVVTRAATLGLLGEHLPPGDERATLVRLRAQVAEIADPAIRREAAHLLRASSLSD